MPTKYITKIFIIACSFLFAQPAIADPNRPISEWEEFRSYTDCQMAIEIANGATEFFVEFGNLTMQSYTELEKKVEETKLYERIEEYKESHPNFPKNRETYPISRIYAAYEIKAQLSPILLNLASVALYRDDLDQTRKKDASKNVRARLARVNTAYTAIEKKCNYKFKQ